STADPSGITARLLQSHVYPPSPEFAIGRYISEHPALSTRESAHAFQFLAEPVATIQGCSGAHAARGKNGLGWRVVRRSLHAECARYEHTMARGVDDTRGARRVGAAHSHWNPRRWEYV